MKNSLVNVCLAAAALCVSAGGLRARNAADRNYAQALVDQVMTVHPDLLVVAMHVTAPGASENRIIATNLDRIGHKSDEDDLAVMKTGRPIVAPTKGRYEILLPLREKSGGIIGSLGVVFMCGEGQDTSSMLPAAEAIAAQLQAATPDPAALLGPAPADDLLLHPGPVMEIPDSAGKFDFLQIDPVRHRLLASHEKDGTSDFFDLGAYRMITRLKLGPAVDVATDQYTGKYFVSASETRKVVVLDAATLAVTNTIPTDGNLDAILFDPHNREIYATNDDGDKVWAIDADVDTEKVVATIPIPGAPEYMVYDAKADRIYLNIKATNEVAVIDPAANAVVARWATGPAEQPHGLALDPATRRLFVAGGNGRLALLDARTGTVLGAVAIASGVDQIAFDPATRRIYCAGAGELSVVQETEDGARLLGNVTTPPTAKNVAVDPATHMVWTTFTDGRNSYAKSWWP